MAEDLETKLSDSEDDPKVTTNQNDDSSSTVTLEDYRKQVEQWEAEKKKMQDALKRANKEAQEFRHALKPFKDLDVDPEIVASWKEQLEQEELRKAEEKQEWEKLRQKLEENHQKELQKREEVLNSFEEERQQIQNELERYLIDSQLKEDILRAGGEPEFLLDKMKPLTKVQKDETGQYKRYIVDENGNMTEANDFSELVNKFKEHPVYIKAFSAPESSGAGITQNTQDGKAILNKKVRKSDLDTYAKKEAFITEYGFDKYKALDP